MPLSFLIRGIMLVINHIIKKEFDGLHTCVLHIHLYYEGANLFYICFFHNSHS